MKNYIRFLSLFLIIAMLVNSLAGCNFFNSGEDETEFVIPYEENYLINKLKPTEKNYYEEFTYTDKNSKAMYMGGYPYYGGFQLRTQGLIEEKNSSYAVFDISEYAGKTLSFVMGSSCCNGYMHDYYALVSVQLDGKQVIEDLVHAYSVPKRYTLDLTGKSELKFLIREGSNDIYVAEFTVWDGEPAVTGHTPDTSKNKVQLIKDLLPYLWQQTEGAIYTENNIKDDTVKYSMAEAVMTSYYADRAFKYEQAKISGKSYYEVFTANMSMQIIGDDVLKYYFNTEKQYKYLSFSAGALHESNSAPGSTWISVYADGKRVLEEEVSSDSLSKNFTVDINNAAMIEFEFKYSKGGSHTAAVFNAFVGKTESDVAGSNDSVDIDNLPAACKLISNIPPYLVSSAYEDPLFDGSSEYLTFSMAGRKYNEGIALYSEASWLLGNRGAHICFNLEGKFKYLTFRAGILDKTVCVLDDALNIYLDGKLSETIELHAMNIPQMFTVDLKNCKELKIELVGRDSMSRPSYGLAEMVVYKDKVTEHNLFPKPENNYPAKMDLIENIRPYMTYVATAKFMESSVSDPHTQVVYDGSTKQKSFTAGGKTHYAGVLLRTAVHLDLGGLAGGTDAVGVITASMSCPWIYSGISILASPVVYESAFSTFDLQGEFKKVTFTVACQDPDWYLTGMEQETTLKIGSNQELYKTIKVSRDMKPTTYTVDIKNTEQLVFYLECGDSASSYYAIYDIVVEK